MIKLLIRKLIALASWRWGISRRTALEYLTTLKNADLVEQEDNIISPSKRGLEEIEFPETKLTKEEKEILEVWSFTGKILYTIKRIT